MTSAATVVVRALVATVALALATRAPDAAASPADPTTGPTPALARFAVIVGANDGGPGRAPLRWAVRDAERVADVLGELGSVPDAHRVLLRDPARADLERALALATGLVVQHHARGERTELVVYYSGHADAGGLLLGTERFDYPSLRARLEAVPADVRVVILDACASGAMLRGKGGTPAAPFVDAGEVATGHAYLASAAADEVAQESDRLEASFFTHHFVAGLRGAADASGDGRVTLTEAYDHAFHETLSGTAETLSGPQHPSYDIALAGGGDLVLTRLAGSARLVLAAPLAGRAFVRDADGRLVGEVAKTAGRAVALALQPGRYRVAMVVARRVLATDVTLTGGDALVAREALLDIGPALETRERGGTLLVDALPRPERSSAVRFSIVPFLGFEGFGDDLVVRGLDLALIADRVAVVRGVQLALGFTRSDEVGGLQAAAVAIAGRVRGAQVGLVTYARSVEGVALAPFPWVDDGVHVVESWADTRGEVGVGYRLGPRHLHVAGAVSWRPGDGACGAPGVGVAFGTRADLGPVVLDLDLGVRLALPGCAGEHELVTRALVGLPLVAGFGLYAGLGLSGARPSDGVGFALVGLRFDR